MKMNAIELAFIGIAIVFSTLSILAIVTYIIGKIAMRFGRKDKRKVAAIVAKLHAEGRL
jgi:Na+-transporting methylmalonyl-CoA/oxaloacetate decarboxylase gamma subunit